MSPTEDPRLKRIALLAVIACLVVPQAFAGPWLKSLPAAQKQARDKREIIYVDLFADWCGWCHQLEQQVFPSETFQKATSDKILLRLNTEDGADGTKLAQQYQVASLPTSLLVTPDMVVVGMIKGFYPAPQLVEAIKEVEKNYADFQKRAGNEGAIATDYQKRLDLAREFRSRFAFPQASSRFKKLTAEKTVPPSVRDQAYFELALTQYLDKKLDDSMKTIRQFSTVQSAGENYERSRVLASEIYAQQGNILGAVNELKNFKAKFPKSPMMMQVNIILPQLEQRLAAGRVQ